MHKLTLIFVLLHGVSFASQGPAAPSSEEPWGYLYSFRTLRLFPLSRQENGIGRLPDNEVVLTSPRVSRSHAAIRRNAEGVELVDVGSTNGSRLNGRRLRPLASVPLAPGDRIQLADELLLYHVSLDELWHQELRHRLLASVVKLNLQLPRDETWTSFGREEVVPAVTEARIVPETGKIEVEHSARVEPESGFPPGSGAFVGNVGLRDGALELSLWTVAGGGAMTSRRSSLSNLKHTTLRISIMEEDGGTEGRGRGPWFPPPHLSLLFDVFPEAGDFDLQFAHSLATTQERAIAFRDAAETLFFQHELDPEEWELLLLAAQSRGRYVAMELDDQRSRLTESKRAELDRGLGEASEWLERARELGADDDALESCELTLRRAQEQLSQIESAQP